MPGRFLAWPLETIFACLPEKMIYAGKAEEGVARRLQPPRESFSPPTGQQLLWRHTATGLFPKRALHIVAFEVRLGKPPAGAFRARQKAMLLALCASEVADGFSVKAAFCRIRDDHSVLLVVPQDQSLFRVLCTQATEWARD